MACLLQMGAVLDEHMVDVTTMEPAAGGENAIQVLLTASNSTHAAAEEGAHMQSHVMDALGQQYSQHYEQVQTHASMRSTLLP